MSKLLPLLKAGLTRNLVTALAIAAALAGCQHDELRTFEGYAEGEYVRLVAPYAGNLSTLAVKRGAKVTEGTQIFSVAEAEEVTAHSDATKRLEAFEKLRQHKGTVADVAVEESLKAQVAQTEWKLAQKSAHAPVDGVVTETLFSKGDWVPAGASVVAILRVDKIKVRFSVPLSVAVHLQHGHNVTLTCERCDKTIEATVTHVSPFAQNSSEGDTLDALRYGVEVRPNPEQAALLKPGQSVTVHI